MQAAKRVVLNTGFLYIRMAITVFISLYATRLVLNALGAQDFGLFNVVGGAIAMLTFLNGAMATATQRFMSYAQGEGNFKKQQQIFNVSLVLHIIIAFLVLIVMEVIGYFLFNGILKIAPDRIEVGKLIFQFMLISTFFTIISVPYDAVINAHENMLLVAILGIVEAIFKLAIAIYITHTTYDKLTSYGILTAILSVFLLIIRQIYCSKTYHEVKINIKKYFNRALFKEMTGFAGWSFAGTSTSMLANYGQGIVINMYFGTFVNAAQGIASQVSGQLGAFANTMLKALNPVISKSEGAGNRTLMLRASIMGSKVSFFLLMFFYIPALLEMPLIFKYWLKVVPEFAVIFCRYLLIRDLIGQLFVTLSSSISAVGNIRKFQIYTSTLTLFPLVVSAILFMYGFQPASIYVVFIFYTILLSIMILYFAKVNCSMSISLFLKEVVLRCSVSFFITLGGAALPILFLPSSFYRFILVGAISSVLYCVTIWFLGINKEEKNLVITLILGIKEKIFKKTALNTI